MQETWVWSLGWENALEKGTATHSSILTWRIPRTTAMGSQESSGLSDFHSSNNWRSWESKQGERKHSHLGVPESWEEGRAEMKEERQKFMGNLGSSRRLDRSILQGTDGSKSPDGSQGRSREEDSRRAEGKRKGDREWSRETDELNEVETSSVQMGEGTGSRRLLNWLDKDYEVVIHWFLLYLIAQSVKNLLAMQGGEDSLEKEMATHSSILAWRIP